MVGICLFFSEVMIGLSTTFLLQCMSMFLIGISSGLYIVGQSFISWADKSERDKVVIALSLASICGTLSGPTLGSILYSIMPEPWPLFTFGFLALLMLLLIIAFLYVFRDVDSDLIKTRSDYDQLEKELVLREEELRDLEEIEKSDDRKYKIRGKNQKKKFGINIESLEDLDRQRKVSDYYSEDGNSKQVQVIYRDERNGSKTEDAKNKDFKFENVKDINKPDIPEMLSNANEREQRLFLIRKQFEGMDTLEIIWNNQPRRYMFYVFTIAPMIKIIDTMIFSMWSEMPRSHMGLGFNPVQTGLVTTLSFPLVALLMYFNSQLLNQGRRTTWMAFALVVVFLGMIVTGYIAQIFDTDTPSLFIAILINGVKDGSYLIWLSQWTTLMNKLFPNRIHGQVYGYCYFLNHIAFCIGSLVFPRLFTMFVSEDSFFSKQLGIFTVMGYFSILGCPLIILTALTFRIQTLVKEQDQLDI